MKLKIKYYSIHPTDERVLGYHDRGGKCSSTGEFLFRKTHPIEGQSPLLSTCHPWAVQEWHVLPHLQGKLPFLIIRYKFYYCY